MRINLQIYKEYCLDKTINLKLIVTEIVTSHYCLKKKRKRLLIEALWKPTDFNSFGSKKFSSQRRLEGCLFFNSFIFVLVTKQ